MRQNQLYFKTKIPCTKYSSHTPITKHAQHSIAIISSDCSYCHICQNQSLHPIILHLRCHSYGMPVPQHLLQLMKVSMVSEKWCDFGDRILSSTNCIAIRYILGKSKHRINVKHLASLHWDIIIGLLGFHQVLPQLSISLYVWEDITRLPVSNSRNRIWREINM